MSTTHPNANNLGSPTQQEPDAQAAAAQKFHQMLGLMVGAGERVSDLFFSPGNPPLVELLGQLTPVNLPGLDKLTAGHTAAISRMLHSLASDSRQR